MPTTLPRRLSRRQFLGSSIAAVTAASIALPALGQSAVPSVPIGQVDHPTGPTDIVLSMETGGGFAPYGFLLIQAPTFVLYGDNTAIFRPSEVGTSTDMPPFIRATLSAEQVDALLTYAMTTGRLADAQAQYTNDRVMDGPTTVFRLDAGGLDKTVSVYALGIGAPDDPAVAQDWAGFEQLSLLLSEFETAVEQGQVQSAEIYQPELYRAALSESFADDVDAINWPWTDIAPEDFQPQGEGTFTVAGLSPDQVALLGNEPSGGSYGRQVRSPDGETIYLLQYRPLLPGEPLVPEGVGGKGF